MKCLHSIKCFATAVAAIWFHYSVMIHASFYPLTSVGGDREHRAYHLPLSRSSEKVRFVCLNERTSFPIIELRMNIRYL